MIVRYLDRFGYGDIGEVRRYRVKENILWNGNILDNGVLNGFTSMEEKIYVFDEIEYNDTKKTPFSIIDFHCKDYAGCLITNRDVFIMDEDGNTKNIIKVIK